MRINRFVAEASGLSRRAADTAIDAGRVHVNGHTAKLGSQVSADDLITLDNQPLTPPAAYVYVMLHKPVGYVSSRVRQGDDPTVYQLIPEHLHHLKIAGRLDRDSSGLILLSDDGGFIHQLTHPSAEKTKAYHLTLSKPLTAADQAKLSSGVMLTDGLSQVDISRTAGRTVDLALGEGRNRQLRRTFGALGYDVLALHRSRIGPYELGDLASGAWKQFELTSQPAGAAA
jgi:23S rRNA pseudouridine2605 synthase